MASAAGWPVIAFVASAPYGTGRLKSESDHPVEPDQVAAARVRLQSGAEKKAKVERYRNSGWANRPEEFARVSAARDLGFGLGRERRWRDGLPKLLGVGGEDYPLERVIPYAFRHSFAQRHADNGTPLDVLATMMGHSATDTTRGYYKVNKSRMRKAVARVSEMQLNHAGNRVSTSFAGFVDAEYDRYQVGQIAVAFGTCHEPSNVKSSGQSCPYRYRCFGCTHFRTDPSYLPELRGHLQKLLSDHERLNAATDGMIEDWARRDALPAPEEIVAARRLIRNAEAMLDGLTPEERATVDELFDVIRRARANIDTALPIHLSATVRQPAPTLYPQSAGGASRS